MEAGLGSMCGRTEAMKKNLKSLDSLATIIHENKHHTAGNENFFKKLCTPGLGNQEKYRRIVKITQCPMHFFPSHT